MEFWSETGVNEGGTENFLEPRVMDGLDWSYWLDRAGKCMETGVTG